MFAGGITAGMQDARHAVRRFHCQGDFPFQRIEGDAEFYQVGDSIRRFGGQDSHGLFIT